MNIQLSSVLTDVLMYGGEGAVVWDHENVDLDIMRYQVVHEEDKQ